MKALRHREIYFEYVLQGDILRISAIDALTGLEVYVLGKPNQKLLLRRQASHKLYYLLDRHGFLSSGSSAVPRSKPSRHGGYGGPNPRDL